MSKQTLFPGLGQLLVLNYLVMLCYVIETRHVLYANSCQKLVSYNCVGTQICTVLQIWDFVRYEITQISCKDGKNLDISKLYLLIFQPLYLHNVSGVELV